MDDQFTNINIIHKDYLADFENKYLDLIKDKIELDDYYLIETIETNEINNDNSTHNINVAIAAAITSYARIHMSQFKNNSNINLYYTDTDSIYTDSILDDNLISNKTLGKLKLENIAKKAIFLSPKVYCLNLISDEIIYKAKGLKHEVDLNINDFENLLTKNFSLEKNQTK
jgi:hypothetical protein